MNLSFHDTFALAQKSMTPLKTSSNQADTESAIEKSCKLVLRCYNTLASQLELSGVHVASYLMNWNDHYTTHKFEGLLLIQIEQYLQTQLNEIRTKQKLEHSVHDVTDDDVYDNEETVDGDNNNDEEHFQIQSAESDKKNTYSLTQQYSWKIIENIQLLHECKKDRDEHLLQVIAESQVENDAIDPVLLPANQGVDGEYDIDGSDQLLELLENLDEYTTTTANANKKSTENKYIEETIEAVENVGRFSHMNCEYDFNVSCRIENDDIKFIIASQ
ncbi:unnamed protein product [Rotaria socialis]|uniref:Uncharacterized protein n=1 Tax=Rotaria socialis TaxID=392032 RepID=A0A819A100_9BILA|nr:unnamed protein product [Rotaria socialis]CAF4886483.1 unnamed protein product [Rotaria socialis]